MSHMICVISIILLLFNELLRELMNQEAELTEKKIKDTFKQLWDCLTGKHSKCNDGCPGKTNHQKSKPLINVDKLRHFTKKVNNKTVQVKSMPEDLYKSLFTDYLLSEKFMKDIISAEVGSHIEAFHQSIYSREIVVKNHPINTVYRGNRVSISVISLR